ncbi:MAG: hypothetical protein IJ458_04335 [Clostridia bacterium]|nr:hypothetical protein [Clostridia bacterium]
MSKKGYKKGSARIVAAGIAAGAITFTLIGGSIAYKLKNQPENPYNEDFVSDMSPNNLVEEPTIETEPNYGDYQPDEILPELQQPIIPDDSKVDEMGAEFGDVLALLTQKCKDYIQSTTGGNANSLKVANFNSISIDRYTGEVALVGQLTIGDKINNYVVTMDSENASLSIYGLSTEVTPQQLIDAMYKYLSNSTTTFTLQLKQHFTLSNEAEVINNMLQTRLDELNALNSTNPEVLDEINHLNTLLQDNADLNLIVLQNPREELDNGYNYSFSANLHTGKYLYTSNHSFTSNRVLTTSALKLNIEQCLDDVNSYEVSVVESNAVNQALYIVSKNFTSNNKNENTLLK